MGTLMVIIVFLIFALLNTPIAFSILIPTIVSLGVSPVSAQQIVQIMQNATQSGSLIAIPFFIIAGMLMDEGKVTNVLVDFAYSVVGHIKGGLAHVVVMGAMLFGGVSGSCVADTAAIGSVMLPAMREKKYDIGFSASLAGAAGTLGHIIPPSIPMIILGIAANVSIGRLFLGGIIPGILVGVVMMVYAFFVAKKKKYPVEERVPLKEVPKRFLKSIPPLLLVVIIVVGIAGGVFTPTEAGAIACVYAIFLGVVVYKKIKLKNLLSIILKGSKITAIVMFVVIASSVLSMVLTYARIPDQLANLLLSISNNKFVLLFIINLLLLFLGMFLDPTPIILLVAPIFFPIITKIGIDPVHFGVVFVMNMAIGQITPPVGAVLYTTANIANCSLPKVIKPMIPLILLMFVLTILVSFLPPLVLTIPQMLMP